MKCSFVVTCSERHYFLTFGLEVCFNFPFLNSRREVGHVEPIRCYASTKIHQCH